MRFTNFLARPLVAAVLIGNVVFGVVALLRGTGVLEPLELETYDLLLRHTSPAAANERVVVIGETEDDLQRFGHPLSDAVLARALQKLLTLGPRVVGVDKYRDIPVPPGTQNLSDTLVRSPQVFWIFQFGTAEAGRVEPPAALKSSGRTGFNDLLIDSDGVARRGLVFLDDGRQTYTSFALLMALHFLAAEGVHGRPDPEEPAHFRLGPTTVPPLPDDVGGYVSADMAGYQFLLDYRDSPGASRRYSLSELMDDRIPAAAVADRAVLLGGTAESLGDYFYTPTRERLYGVELQGRILDQLLRFGFGESEPIRAYPPPAEYAWIWAWALAAALIGIHLRSVTGFAFHSILGLVILGTLSAAAFATQRWVPLAPPALAWIAAIGLSAAYLSALEKRQRELLMNLFSRHVSKDVADAIWQQRNQFLEHGRPKPQRLTATVLFTDIRGFTTISERFDANELMQWLNRYMERMASIVIRNGGVINKYIGDAIMALFGVPVARTSTDDIARDANSAVRTALEMGRELERLNDELRAEGLPPIGMRVGIYTGVLVAGSLGSKERCEYTVIGDSVNTASRLESFGRADSADYDDPVCRILIGQSTARLLDESFNMRLVGSVRLKGKSAEVPIYQVIRSEAAEA